MSKSIRASQAVTAADFARMSETEQRLVAERILKIQESGWKPFWCPNPLCTGEPHVDASGKTDPQWAHNHARQDQRLPTWQEPWILGVLSGRGAGKTTSGVEFTTLSSRKGLDGAIIGRRGTELENTHVATILARAHPEFMPEYKASKDILSWPNGATTYLFSAERPENIRSVNLSWYWIDEAAHMPEIKKVWMNVRLATRIETPGNPIHGLITSTPTPTPWMMELEDNPDVEIRRVSTYANKANLSAAFLEDMEKEYEGTRMGRQELHGEVLRDVEGALWNDDMFQHLRVDADGYEELLESLDDRVVSVDPAGSANKRSDLTGIIGAGIIHSPEGGHFYVVADGTLKGAPTEWAAQVFRLARSIRAHRIVVEKNFGGDMVLQTLKDYAKLNPTTTCDENGEDFPIKLVHAVKSKETRAEPTVARYEQARVTHVVSPGVFGDMSSLEKEQVGWVPASRGGKMPSPNRVDALVWNFRELTQAMKFLGQMATQSQVLKKLKPRGVGPRG